MLSRFSPKIGILINNKAMVTDFGPGLEGRRCDIPIGNNPAGVPRELVQNYTQFHAMLYICNQIIVITPLEKCLDFAIIFQSPNHTILSAH